MPRQLDCEFVRPRPHEVIERGQHEPSQIVQLQPAVGETFGRHAFQRFHVSVERFLPALGLAQQLRAADIASQAFLPVRVAADQVPVAAERVFVIVIGLEGNAEQIEGLPGI